jgi:mannose-6-phosphate isomerase-like protein (cupin superfamily)
MSERSRYNINTEVKYGQLEVIDVPAIVAACTEKWFNQTLTRVNDSVVRLGIVEGEFHWHKHDRDDEFFFVLEGRLLIDLQDRTVELEPGQGMTIPKSVMHRPRAPQKTVMLMVENHTIEPTGDKAETLDSGLKTLDTTPGLKQESE